MPFTAYEQAWLEDPAAIPIVLVEAKVFSVQLQSEITLRFSSTGYNTTDGVVFLPTLVGKVSLTQSISPDGGVSLSFNDLEISNLNGEYDQYLNNNQWVWSNRSIKIYFGDPGFKSSLSQISSKFLLIFDGVIDDIDSRTNKTINLKIRNKLERLNTPVSENKLGIYGVWGASGGQTNTDALRPLVFGECFNITPLLVDPSTLEYMVNDGPINGIIEIRDNGVPLYGRGLMATSIVPGSTYEIESVGTTNFISIGAANNSIGTTFVANNVGSGDGRVKLVGRATVTESSGTFRLASPPSGDITCTVQGVKKLVNRTNGTIQDTHSSSIADLITLLVTQFGKASTKFVVSEIDTQNFSTFSSNNSSALFGVYVTSTETVLDVCQKLASSIGSELAISSTGQLQLIKFGEPYGTQTEITQNDILYNSLAISNRLPIKSAIKLGYAKNWTVQTNLLTAIPQAHKDNFATEWFTVTEFDETIANTHKLETEAVQKDTYLVDTVTAEDEALRLLTYYKNQRTIFKFVGRSRLLSLKLGQPVLLTYPRFGLDQGVSGQVITLTPDWLSGKIEIEVII